MWVVGEGDGDHSKGITAREEALITAGATSASTVLLWLQVRHHRHQPRRHGSCAGRCSQHSCSCSWHQAQQEAQQEAKKVGQKGSLKTAASASSDFFS